MLKLPLCRFTARLGIVRAHARNIKFVFAARRRKRETLAPDMPALCRIAFRRMGGEAGGSSVRFVYLSPRMTAAAEGRMSAGGSLLRRRSAARGRQNVVGCRERPSLRQHAGRAALVNVLDELMAK
jgi:hypothetical protein